MKICILGYKINTFGGGGRFLAEVIRGLQANGHTVTLVEYTGNFFKDVVRTYRAGKDADILQVRDMGTLTLAGYIASRFTRAKFVVVALGTYAVVPLYSFKRSWYAKWIFQHANAVISISKFTADEIRKKVPGLKISIIHMAVNNAAFSDTSTDLREIRDDALIIGVGTVKARKGYIYSLRAFALLKKDFPHLRYAIVGPQVDEPNYVAELKSLAHHLGVEKDLRFFTYISDEELKQLYKDASLFVLTSVNRGLHFEGFGVVFLEAAAQGLPAVGTSGNGIEEAIEDGKTGFLVPQKDPEATAAAIKKILTNKDLYARMSARAREFAKENDSSRIGEQYEALYKTLLAKKS